MLSKSNTPLLRRARGTVTHAVTPGAKWLTLCSRRTRDNATWVRVADATEPTCRRCRWYLALADGRSGKGRIIDGRPIDRRGQPHATGYHEGAA